MPSTTPRAIARFGLPSARALWLIAIVAGAAVWVSGVVALMWLGERGAGRAVVAQALAASAMVATGGWLAARHVTRAVRRPLERLADVMVRRGAGDTAVRVASHDGAGLAWFGRLVNDMFDEVDAATAEVRWQRDELRRRGDAAEAALAELAGLQRAIDEHAIVTVTDLQGRITHVNDRFCRLTGFSRDELIGRTHRRVNSGRHPHEFFAGLWRTVASGRTWQGEVCNRMKDGTLRWFDTTVVPVSDATGRIAKYVAVRSDITVRKGTELALVAANTEYQALLDAADAVAIVATDTEGTIRIFNRGAERMLGYAAAEMIGRQTPVALHLETEVEQRSRELTWQFERDVVGFDVLVERARREGRERREWTFVCKDGTTRAVDLVVTAVRDPTGAVIGYLGVATDISEHRRSEAELQQARERAEDASRAKSEFLAVMSHEIRTPMNGVLGMTSLLLETDLTPEQRDYAHALYRSGESLLDIINDILDFSKVEAGRMAIESVDFDLRRAVADAAGLLRPRADEKGVTLHVESSEDVPDRVMGDPGKVRQVLLNLVSNAIKFTERGEVRVALGAGRRDDRRVEAVVSVADTGIGIARDRLPAIFDPFVQADASTTRRFGGTGLGLAISRRLVEAMGGCLEVDSTLGKGSTFRFRLPLTVADAAAAPALRHAPADGRSSVPDAPAGPREPRPSPLGRRRALVASDNLINQRLARRMLEKSGCLVDVAADVDETATLAAQTTYDVVLIDSQSPSHDAQHVARRFRHAATGRHPALVIAVVGAEAQAGVAGADVTLERPVTADTLARALERAPAVRRGVA